MFAEMLDEFKKMSWWDRVMAAFIIAGASLYIYFIGSLTIAGFLP